MGLRLSCIIHACVLLLLTGCSMHRRAKVTPEDLAVFSGRSFVAEVGGRIPLWDADEKYAWLEKYELATVKADVAAAKNSDTTEEFLKYVNKLHNDWDVLL